MPFAGHIQSTSSLSVPADFSGSGVGEGPVGATAGGGTTAGVVGVTEGTGVSGGVAPTGDPPESGALICANARSENGTFVARGSTFEAVVLASGPRLDGRRRLRKRRGDGRARRQTASPRPRPATQHQHLPDLDAIRIGDVVPCHQIAIVETVLQRDAHERIALLHGMRGNRRRGRRLWRRGRRRLRDGWRRLHAIDPPGAGRWVAHAARRSSQRKGDYLFHASPGTSGTNRTAAQRRSVKPFSLRSIT